MSKNSSTPSKNSSHGKRISKVRKKMSRSSGVTRSKYREEIMKFKIRISQTKGKLNLLLKRKKNEFRSIKELSLIHI